MNYLTEILGAKDSSPQLASTPEHRFELLLAELIIKGLKESLGESGAAATLYHVKKLSFKARNITSYPEALHYALEEVFGIGSKIIEEHILGNLYSKLGLPFDLQTNDLSFSKCIERARRIFQVIEKMSELNLEEGSKIYEEMHPENLQEAS